MKPRVRPLEPQWIDNDGQPALLLRDRLGLIDGVAIVPPTIAVLLSLCDGTRDRQALRAAFEVRTGVQLSLDDLDEIFQQLDQALLLESPRFTNACRVALAEYRSAPHRPAALAGGVYPGHPKALTRALRDYGRDIEPICAAPADEVRGVVGPHIDYMRGGPMYYRVWHRAAEAVKQAEVVIVFGTDHIGGPGQITLTRQHYSTPYGTLPTAQDIVTALADAIGPDAAFAEELHHRNEHSIELSAVWVHYLRQDRPVELVPILCGSFHPFTEGERNPADDPGFQRLVETLRAITTGRRTIAVASADLAHVGPAFGDPTPFDEAERARLRKDDNDLLAAVSEGDAEKFFGILRDERDRRKVCGLPPIYLLLRYLGASRGEVVGYDQCPADSDRASWVSIGGVILS